MPSHVEQLRNSGKEGLHWTGSDCCYRHLRIHTGVRAWHNSCSLSSTAINQYFWGMHLPVYSCKGPDRIAHGIRESLIPGTFEEFRAGGSKFVLRSDKAFCMCTCIYIYMCTHIILSLSLPAKVPLSRKPYGIMAARCCFGLGFVISFGEHMYGCLGTYGRRPCRESTENP